MGRVDHISNNRGIALLVTLAFISVLMVAAIELSGYVSNLADGQKRVADRLQAQEVAKSGIELAMFILVRDAEQNDLDSIQEMWADSDIMASAVELLGFDRSMARLDLQISDELGKIQINALLAEFPGADVNNDQVALWERFLNLVILNDKSLDIRDPAEIINSLKDWLDSGDDDAISGLSGAESDYYQSLDPPVVCSNAPLNSVEELFMIKGISESITSIPAKLTDISTKESYLQLDPSTIFTVYGIDSIKKEGKKFTYSGRININTADITTLAAMLPIGMEDQASELASFRLDKSQDGQLFVNSLDKGWYKKVISLSAKDTQIFERIVRYSSDLFRVDAAAQFNGVDGSLTGFIKREKDAKTGRWGCKIIQIRQK
ncbi:MAG: general secretion pathway protein GspK [Desulfamplus sp.]|nr:general secretion pathway protein GspK [Desulfamplus sp.]